MSLYVVCKVDIKKVSSSTLQKYNILPLPMLMKFPVEKLKAQDLQKTKPLPPIVFFVSWKYKCPKEFVRDDFLKYDEYEQTFSDYEDLWNRHDFTFSFPVLGELHVLLTLGEECLPPSQDRYTVWQQLCKSHLSICVDGQYKTPT